MNLILLALAVFFLGFGVIALVTTLCVAGAPATAAILFTLIGLGCYAQRQPLP